LLSRGTRKYGELPLAVLTEYNAKDALVSHFPSPQAAGFAFQLFTQGDHGFSSRLFTN
jgi:hypothetical protein